MSSEPKMNRGIIVMLSMAMFVVVIDTTIMNVSISALVHDLDTQVSTIQAAISFYALVMASFMIAGSKISDIIGRRRAFSLGLIMFGVGAAGTALSLNAAMLIFFWSVIEGLAAALIFPSIQTLIRINYKDRLRARAYGVIWAVAGAGAALGPIIGGFITATVSWRLAFALETVVVVIVLSRLKILAPDRKQEKSPHLDYTGTLLSISSLASIIVGIFSAKNYGWFTSKQNLTLFGKVILPAGSISISIILIISGLLLLAVFYLWERRLAKHGGEPLVRPSLFKKRGVTTGISLTLVQQFTLGSYMFLIPVFVQMILGYDALKSGLTVLPASLSMVAVSMLTPRLASHLYPKYIVEAGLLLVVSGLVVLRLVIDQNTSGIDLAPGMILMGTGLGLMLSQLANIVLSSVNTDEAAEAAGLNSTSSQFGLSLGTAIAGAVMLASLSFNFINMAEQSSVLNENQKAAVSSALEQDARLISNQALENQLQGQPQQVQDEIVRINTEARPKAFDSAFLVAAVIGSLGFIISLWLPRKKLAK